MLQPEHGDKEHKRPEHLKPLNWTRLTAETDSSARLRVRTPERLQTSGLTNYEVKRNLLDVHDLVITLIIIVINSKDNRYYGASCDRPKQSLSKQKQSCCDKKLCVK
jgi:hypothetical protein